MNVTSLNPVKVLLERGGYRFVEAGILEINGKPDFRMQKKNEYTKRWNDIYLFDNGMQCSLAMEDAEYAKWLDPDPEVGAYRHWS